MKDRPDTDPVEAEIEFHLERRAEEHRRRGSSSAEARRRAVRAFGDLESTRRYCRRKTRRCRRRRRRRQMFDELVQDTRYAFRQIARSPGTSAIVILTLALGIGANTAIFSLARAALLRSPPVADPARLVALWTTCRAGDPRCASSYPDIGDYRERSATLADLAYQAALSASLDAGDGGRVVDVELTSGNLFGLLGLLPAHGRLILPSDDVRGGALVTALSYDLWRDQFGADPGVIGSTIALSGNPYEIVGVTPEGYRGLNLGRGADLYVPLASSPELGEPHFVDRGRRWIDQLVGRMRPGAGLEQVRAEMRAISDQLAAEDPDARGPRAITVDPASRMLLPAGSEASLRRFVAMLLAVAGLTLLLACANLANLQIVRTARRYREMAVRAAIGAARGRLVRQLFTENLLLSLLGGVVGLATGPMLLRALAGFELPGRVGVTGLQAGLEPPVFFFAFALAVTTGVLFGLGPVLHSARRDISAVLATGSRQRAAAAPFARGGLVAVQVGLSIILLTGGLLFLRALRAGLELELGFDAGHDLVVATIDLSLARYEPDRADAFIDVIEERARAMPGTTAFAVATRVPLLGNGTATRLDRVDGYMAAPDEELRFEYNLVTPGFFAALGLPLLDGSAFDDGPLPDAPAGAMVINEEMASRWWSGRRAVGGTLRLDGAERTGHVVGVVANAKWDDGMLAVVYPFAYMPLSGDAAAGGPVHVMVRSQRPHAAVALLRSIVHDLDPAVPLIGLSTLGAVRREALLPQRMGTGLLGAFALLALFLLAIGVYGVVGHAVGERTRELGVRMALGAGRGRIARTVATGMVAPVLTGVVVGLLGALALTGTIRSFLYGVNPADPIALLLVTGLLIVVTGVAAWLPARRAGRIEPVVAIRHD